MKTSNLFKSVFTNILLLCSTSVLAEGVDIVTLTTTAEGRTKDEAIINALRSAIEQSYGAFVSSNTTIVNDELLRDEIVTVSSGNIKKFNVLSEMKMPNGNTFVSVKAEVSVAKLTKFAESKGVEVEFKGALFAANIKLQQLYEQNELKALENLRAIINDMIVNCFDYEIEVTPPVVHHDKWLVEHKVTIKANSNLNNVYAIIKNTLSGLSMTGEEVQNYREIGKKVYAIYIYTEKEYSKDIKRGRYALFSRKNALFLRNAVTEIIKICNVISFAKLNYTVDNGLFTTQFYSSAIKGSDHYNVSVDADLHVNLDGRMDIGRKGQALSQGTYPYYRRMGFDANDKHINDKGEIGLFGFPDRFKMHYDGGKDRGRMFFRFYSGDSMIENACLSFFPDATINFMSWKNLLSLPEIEKIQKYTVKAGSFYNKEKVEELYQESEYKEIISLFETGKIDQKDLNDDELKHDLACSYYYTKEYAKAINILESTRDNGSRDEKINFLLAHAYFFTKEYAKAITVFKSMLDKKPGRYTKGEIYYCIACSYSYLNDREEYFKYLHLSAEAGYEAAGEQLELEKK